MQNKNKYGASAYGTGLVYSLKEITELVRTLIQGINYFVETLLTKGRWLLFLAVMLFTIPYLLDQQRIERVFHLVNQLMKTMAENQRQLIKEQSQAQLHMAKIIHEADKQKLALELQLADLESQVFTLDAEHTPSEIDFGVKPVKSIEPNRCNNPKRRQFSFSDGCDYRSM